MPHSLIEENPDLATAIDILDSWVDLNMHKSHQPGLALGIVYDGELLWGKGYGVGDLDTQTPITLDTRFRIASITKTFTATGIMQLRDAGKLNLDDPVSKYLDWFNLRYEDSPEITIRHLLSHASGLPRDSHNSMWRDQNSPTWDEFVEATKQRAPTRPPNDKFAYSNLGYSLLGGIIAEVSGQSWEDYLQENILNPLGMTETYPVPKADDSQLAKGYSRFDDNYDRTERGFWLMQGFEASANFASSINDLVKYAKFHLSKGKTPILSGHTLRDMHRVHWLYDKWEGGYGLGISSYKIKDWVISGHSGGYPGYITLFSLCREHNVGVIALTNAHGISPFIVAERAYKQVLPEIIKATAKAQSESDPAWEKYLGEYADDWGISKVVIRKGKLQMVSLEFIDAPAVTLTPTNQEHVFTIEQMNQSNETARFELDDKGKVTKMWIRNEYVIRKD